MVRSFVAAAIGGLVFLTSCASPRSTTPSVIVLGIAQDGGVPQAGAFDEPGWDDPSRREKVTALGVFDPSSGERWMIDCTPDFREQLTAFSRAVGIRAAGPVLDGILLTHAHIGHYTGLMFLGHESMGSRAIPVWTMPKMRTFLETNGPWSQLVRKENIKLCDLAADRSVSLNARISITPILVPHRQEFSEVVGLKISGPSRSVLFIPDIDSWTDLDAEGRRIEDMIADVDIAYLDGTFFENGEIPGRDMTGFPHPFIRTSLDRFGALPESERRKIRFIHLNHTNPALDPAGPARAVIHSVGCSVAAEGEVTTL